MMKRFLVVWALLFVALESADAAPIVSSFGTTSSPTEIVLSLSAQSSLESCTISFSAASRKVLLAGAVDRGYELAQVRGSSTEVEVRLDSVRVSAPNRAYVFVRGRIFCADGTTTNTEILTIRMFNASRSSIASANEWLARLQARFAVRGVELSQSLEGLGFERPLEFIPAIDGTSNVFVLEQEGKIWRVDLAQTPRTKVLFLDLSSRVKCCGEQGLLGLAFHPEFATNRSFFVHYSAATTGDAVISRFQTPEGDLLTGDVSTESLLLTVEQPFANHNGGRIAFGPDGFLYIGFGDGGSGGDPFGNGQNRNSLLGKLLRIDVDGTSEGRTYGIPSSNPFLNSPEGYRDEIFAYGLRNPFKFSFDTVTGDLWLGDVGQNSMEEVDLVERGGNYGWNIMEGSLCYPTSKKCSTLGLTAPVFEYRRKFGSSVTGGYVYRGSAHPGLYGKYVFADFTSGRIMALARRGQRYTRIGLFDTEHFISSLGLDRHGEIYILHYGTGDRDDGFVYTLD